jgi:hypothetical protein
MNNTCENSALMEYSMVTNRAKCSTMMSSNKEANDEDEDVAMFMAVKRDLTRRQTVDLAWPAVSEMKSY